MPRAQTRHARKANRNFSYQVGAYRDRESQLLQTACTFADVDFVAFEPPIVCQQSADGRNQFRG
jgi:hypothetical protein